MSRELWATYSVKDHLQPRRLAADVMLFDRLVFPVPQSRSFALGAVVWAREPQEWARWEEEDWDPWAQEDLLRILAPVAWRAPWRTSGAQAAAYRLEAARLAAEDVPDSAFMATRNLILLDLPAYVSGVAGVGPAYGSFEAFDSDFHEGTPSPALPGRALADVLAAEFYVPDPDDDRLATPEFLRETVEFVTGDEGFRRRRSAYIQWQQDFLKDGRTDPASIALAVEEMRDLVSDTNGATAKLTIRKVVRNVFRLAPSGLGIAASLAGGGPAFAVAGAFLSIGALTVDETLFKKSEQAGASPAAFIHDARRHFGWKD